MVILKVLCKARLTSEPFKESECAKPYTYKV